MHLATRTVKSSTANPIAMANSQAFNSPATRSRRISCCFIGDLALRHAVEHKRGSLGMRSFSRRSSSRCSARRRNAIRLETPTDPLCRCHADRRAAGDALAADEFGNCGLVLTLRHFRLTSISNTIELRGGNDPQLPGPLKSSFSLKGNYVSTNRATDWRRRLVRPRASFASRRRSRDAAVGRVRTRCFPGSAARRSMSISRS